LPHGGDIRAYQQRRYHHHSHQQQRHDPAVALKQHILASRHKHRAQQNQQHAVEAGITRQERLHRAAHHGRQPRNTHTCSQQLRNKDKPHRPAPRTFKCIHTFQHGFSGDNGEAGHFPNHDPHKVNNDQQQPQQLVFILGGHPGGKKNRTGTHCRQHPQQSRPEPKPFIQSLWRCRHVCSAQQAVHFLLSEKTFRQKCIYSPQPENQDADKCLPAAETVNRFY